MSPWDTVASAGNAAVFEGLPDVGCLSAETYGHVSVEGSYGIYEEGIEFDAFVGAISQFIVGGTFEQYV